MTSPAQTFKKSPIDTRRIRINDIDTYSAGYPQALTRDASGGEIIVDLRVLPAGLQILPNIGEEWWIGRQAYRWILLYRVQTDQAANTPPGAAIPGTFDVPSASQPGDPQYPVPTDIANATPNVGTVFSPAYHVHPRESFGPASDVSLSVPGAVADGGSGVVLGGSLTKNVAHPRHVHAREPYGASTDIQPIQIGGSPSSGVGGANAVAHARHVHTITLPAVVPNGLIGDYTANPSHPGDTGTVGNTTHLADAGHKHPREAWGIIADYLPERPRDVASIGGTTRVADAGHHHARDLAETVYLGGAQTHFVSFPLNAGAVNTAGNHGNAAWWALLANTGGAVVSINKRLATTVLLIRWGNTFWVESPGNPAFSNIVGTMNFRVAEGPTAGTVRTASFDMVQMANMSSSHEHSSGFAALSGVPAGVTNVWLEAYVGNLAAGLVFHVDPQDGMYLEILEA